ncbi:MAG: M20/M25/M40 family metallo-hydrolase [Alphaproteobacteria bacterium]|nr:M20/M25/M40 family metallo-hydrolase [Alphaproteobacteria bacterium]MBU0796225.1 M20/M25/M40 family metallo-hydrolase [Alphaproteobacteria bacterium]MBU0885736.1 M20/M25/M40 family metallo-hydrolase [Alphaproteobacteria bacterium]MBU1813110.1 M20/M25/M40 family metallo-hydrolase [Alphaproteobacteria bacterium]
MTDQRATLTAYIDSQHAAQAAFLAALVRVPSDNPPGDCAPHGEAAATLLEALGFTVERHPVPAELCAANGMISATNLVIRRSFGDGSGPVIALNAHGDVVAPGEGWSVDPYGAVVQDGVMYGRGVAVSKSDFATYAYALKALEALEAPLNGTVELHFTYDEEAGGAIGPALLLEGGISRPDFAISAGFAYSVVTAHNGCLHLEVTVTGKSAHAARPDTGHDALEAATTILTTLYGLRAGLTQTLSAVPGITHPTLVVGLIEGGINTNVVPDKVKLRLDRRLIPEEHPGEVEAALRLAIEDAVDGLPGIEVEIRRILLATPFGPLPGVERLVEPLTRHASAVMGEAIGTGGLQIYTDARLYTAAGVPTVLYGAGPRSILEANGHRADEKLVLEDLRKATIVVAATLAEMLQG